jgi:hypothetical protein
MFTNKPGGAHPQILNGLPTIGGWAGEFGGAWPAHMWHTFMSENFNSIPVVQLPTPNFAGFTKWVLALPPKKKHKHCRLLPGGGGGQGGGGGGNGNGHGHHVMIALNNGPKQCQGGGPGPTQSPTPHPTFTPSPTPTPTPTVTNSPNPSKSPSPTTSPSTTPPTPFVVRHRQRVPGRTVSSASLSSFAIVPDRLGARPAAVVPSGLI